MKKLLMPIEDEYLVSYYLENEKDPTIKYRLAFLSSLKKLGYDLGKACDIFVIAIPTAYAWIRRWNQDGYNGIASPFHESDNPKGRPAKLGDDDFKKLKMLLSLKSNWLTREVRDLILEKFGVKYSLSQVTRILRKLKIHLSKP